MIIKYIINDAAGRQPHGEGIHYGEAARVYLVTTFKSSSKK